MCRVEILGDSLLVVNWLRGLWDIKFRIYKHRVAHMVNQLERLCQQCLIAPATDSSDFHRHVYRELNTEADAKANFGRVHGNVCWASRRLGQQFPHIRIYCDGSLSGSLCGAGYVVYASDNPG
eukprot:5160788-Karenia_brevis.AAC.1